MIHTIVNTKKNPFFPGQPDMFKEDEQGRAHYVGKYKSSVIPKTSSLRRIPYDYTNKRYEIGKISQEELDKIVREIGLFDKNNNPIVTANPKNERDPFFSHDDLVFVIENGSNVIDDSLSLDKIFMCWMGADDEFKQKGSKSNPALSSKVRYTISTAALDNAAIVEDVDKAMQATELLSKMTYDLQCTVLRAMGVPVTGVEPELVKATLYRKITEEKNVQIQGTSTKNIDMFLELASSSSTKLNTLSLMTMARDKGIITKKASDGKFYMGEIMLGRILTEVQEYLENPDNSDMLVKLVNLLKSEGISV